MISKRWLAVAAAVLAPAGAAASQPSAAVALAPTRAQAGDAVATVAGDRATLSDGLIARTWALGAGQVVTTRLSDPVAHRDWSTPASPDFTITVDSATTSSTSGWTLIDATAAVIPPDPARPAAPRGVELVLRYALPASVAGSPLAGGVIELDRTYTLRSHAAVIGASSELTNHTPIPFRIASYSLQELTSPAAVRAEIETYHGGSDWRDDYRVTTSEAAAFDDEGEVARFDDGTGAGWFLVDERRSGAMSRVARDATGRTWTGVDNARDLFDWGPLMSSPPSYNRLENPAYPAPVRQRTLLPLATIDLGRAYLGVYHGGAQQAAAAFAQEFAAAEMPAFARSVGLNTFHPWGHGAGLSDANLRPQVDTLAGLGGESFMLDDQWQGSSSGDWNWDAQRFPNSNGDGVPDFVDYVHARGLALGLWMSPAEFNPSSQTYKAHPDWACTPIGDVTAQIPDDAGLGVWDMTNPALRDHLTSVIDRLIAQDGVTEFKFDYVTWVDCPPHDYLDYEDAYAAWVREQQARHPNVTFELDETNDQRLWPFRSAALGPSWFDNGHLHGSTAQAKLLHDIWTAAPWLPPSSIGFGTYDGTLGGAYGVDYLMPIALLGHFTFWTDLSKLSSADAAETTWWIGWYKAHRSGLAGLVYEDTTADPLDGVSWAAFQPWKHGRGYLLVFRQGGSQPTDSIALHGLNPARLYSVTDVRSGATLGQFSGAQLLAGLALTLPSPYTARVLAIDPLR